MSDEVNLERLRLADLHLSDCGKPQLPDGARFVDIYKVLVYNNQIAASTTLPDERQGTHSDTIFFVCSIQALPAASNTLRIQWPDGNYLSNAPERINAAMGMGYYRKVLRNHVPIPPGKQIRMSIVNSQLSTAQVIIIFEGYLRYYLKDRVSPACCVERL